MNNKHDRPSDAYDITERKRAEEALRESEAHYRALVEGMPGIVYTFSTKRGCVYCSPNVTNLLGYSPERLHAQPLLWHNSIHPDDLPRIKQVIRDIEAGCPFRVEYRIRDVRGNRHWFDDQFGRGFVQDDQGLFGSGIGG